MSNLDSLPVAEKVAFRRNSVRVMRDLLALSTIMAQAEEYQRAKDLFFVPSRKIWFMFGGTINPKVLHNNLLDRFKNQLLSSRNQPWNIKL